MVKEKDNINKNNELIKITNLEKTFGKFESHKKVIFKNLNLTINKGETLAILGPNGAGKTTLLNIITGLLKQTSGKIEYVGFKSKDDFLSKTGIQFQHSDFPKGFTASQIIDLIFQFNNKKPDGKTYYKWMKEDGQKIKQKLFKTFQLEGKENRKTQTCPIPITETHIHSSHRCGHPL